MSGNFAVAVKLTAPALLRLDCSAPTRPFFDHGNPIAFWSASTGRCTCNPGTDNHHIHRIGEMCTVLNKPGAVRASSVISSKGVKNRLRHFVALT
ncbi:hypothetical protein WDV93_13760 [Pantoea ananatis]